MKLTTALERLAIVIASLALSVGLIALLSGFFAGRDQAGVSGTASQLGVQFRDQGDAQLRPGQPHPAYDSNPPTSGPHVPEPVSRDNAELGNLTGLLAKIKPAIDATTYTGERSAKNYAFVDAVARKNVEMTVAGIRQDSSVLAELEAKGAVKMGGAMYNLETGAVEFFD